MRKITNLSEKKFPFPLPNRLRLPNFGDMKMNSAIRFNRWWWGSRT